MRGDIRLFEPVVSEESFGEATSGVGVAFRQRRRTNRVSAVLELSEFLFERGGRSGAVGRGGKARIGRSGRRGGRVLGGAGRFALESGSRTARSRRTRGGRQASRSDALDSTRRRAIPSQRVHRHRRMSMPIIVPLAISRHPPLLVAIAIPIQHMRALRRRHRRLQLEAPTRARRSHLVVHRREVVERTATARTLRQIDDSRRRQLILAGLEWKR